MTFKPGIYFIQIFHLERNSKWNQASQWLYFNNNGRGFKGSDFNSCKFYTLI